jgi:hypothetical protein
MSHVASYTPIEAAMEPAKLFEGICERGCELGSRSAVQPLYLDEPGTSGRTPEGAFEVANSLGVVVRALPTGGVMSCDRSESNVVDDRIRLRQDQIAAITCVVVRVSAGHVQQAGTVGSGEAVGGSSCGIEFSTGRGSAEMINDGRTDPQWHGSDQGRQRDSAANVPRVEALAAGPGGSGSRHQKPSCRPVRPPHSR